MSLLNQNKKGKNKGDKKANSATGKGGKQVQKTQNNSFVSKQQNTGSQRGS